MVASTESASPEGIQPREGGPVRVGVIGPGELVNKTVAVARRMNGLKIITAPYHDEEEAGSLYDSVVDRVEAVLFTGPVPYYRTLAERHASVPTLYVPASGTGLYRALFQLRDQHDLRCISVDTVSRADVEETYRELGLPSEGVLSLAYSGDISRRDLVEFHSRPYVEGRTSVALTCLHSAYRDLVARGVPCYWLVPTDSDITIALEKAVLAVESSRNRQTQMVVGLLSPDDFEAVAMREGSEYRVQQLRLEIHRTLLQFVQAFDGYLVPAGGEDYLFFTTRGDFERVTHLLTRTSLLDQVRRSLPVTISMGVGFGHSAGQAGAHARIALQQARREGGGRAYAVLEDRRLIGPLGSEAPVSVALRSVDPELLAAAEDAGLSAPTFSRVLAVIAGLRQETFTANDLARGLDVSLRSANRILSRLTATGLVEEAGQEKLFTAGRPRRVYRLARTRVTGTRGT